MKYKLTIILLFFFGIAFGQETDADADRKNTIVTSVHWVTDKCTDLSDSYQNNQCVTQELTRFLQLEMELPADLETGVHRVNVYYTVEIDGTISKVKARSKFENINAQIEKILPLFKNGLRMLDQDGNAHKNTGILPLRVVIEE